MRSGRVGGMKKVKEENKVWRCGQREEKRKMEDVWKNLILICKREKDKWIMVCKK